MISAMVISVCLFYAVARMLRPVGVIFLGNFLNIRFHSKGVLLR